MSVRKTVLSLCIILAIIAPYIHASETERNTVDLIIGGAELRPLATNQNSISFSLGYDLEDALQCGNIDLEDILTQSFGDAAGQVKRLQSQVVSALAATANLGSLAGTAFRKLYPDEYDTIMSGIATVKLDWGDTLSQCSKAQEMLWDATIGGEGKKEAQGFAWAKFNVSAKAGDHIWSQDYSKVVGTSEGINIGGEQKGGASQSPVQAPSDVIDMSFEKFSQNTADPASIGMKFYFANKEDAVKYVEEIAGSRIIRVCDGCESESKAGTGIRPLLIEENTRVETELRKIADMSPTEYLQLGALDFYNVSYNTKVPVNTTLIQSLNNLNSWRRENYLKSWSQEIAMANLMEKTLVARRLLRTGLQEASLKKSAVVNSSTQELIDIIDYELNELEREIRVTKLLTSSTPRAILLQQMHSENKGIRTETAGF